MQRSFVILASAMLIFASSLHARQDGTAKEPLNLPLPAKIDSSGFFDLGIVNDSHLFVPKGPAHYRVGSGGLVRAITYTKEQNTAIVVSLLLACDGSWLTGALRWEPFDAGTEISLAAILKDAIAREEPLLLEPVIFAKSSESQFFFAKTLLRQASSLCKTADQEPRNLLIPVALAEADGDIGESFALLTGTASKTGQEIDVWIRITQYRKVHRLDSEGKPIKFMGELLSFKDATGAYTLVRRAFDCKVRTTSAFEIVDYEATGKVVRSVSEPRETLRLTPVVPGSVGEALMDVVCSLYFQPDSAIAPSSSNR